MNKNSCLVLFFFVSNFTFACEESGLGLNLKNFLLFTSKIFYAQDDILFHGKRNLKNIFLTFDDGPSLKYTPELLKLLKNYGVKASFFVVGDRLNLEEEKNLLKTIRQMGHEVYPHSLVHRKNVFFKSSLELFNEISTLNAKIDRILTHDSQKRNYYRPPWGLVNSDQVRLLKRKGYQVVLGDIFGSFYTLPHFQYEETKQSMTNTIINDSKGGSIIIIHNGEKRSLKDRYFDSQCAVEILKRVIPELIEKGFHFKLLSEIN